MCLFKLVHSNSGRMALVLYNCFEKIFGFNVFKSCSVYQFVTTAIPDLHYLPEFVLKSDIFPCDVLVGVSALISW